LGLPVLRVALATMAEREEAALDGRAVLIRCMVETCILLWMFLID